MRLDHEGTRRKITAAGECGEEKERKTAVNESVKMLAVSVWSRMRQDSLVESTLMKNNSPSAQVSLHQRIVCRQAGKLLAVPGQARVLADRQDCKCTSRAVVGSRVLLQEKEQLWQILALLRMADRSQK